MSYENTACPCGQKKEPQTMICKACIDHVEESPARQLLARWQDKDETLETRRGAAVRILEISRRRLKSPALGLHFNF